MLRAIQVELKKLKKAPMIWISFLGVSISPILNALIFYYLKQLFKDSITWEAFLIQSISFIAVFIGILLFSLTATYVFGREYTENTIKTLFTIPLSRESIIIAKLVILLLWSLTLVLFAFLITIPMGFIIRASDLSLTLMINSLIQYLIVGLMLYALLPIVSLVTMLTRGYIPAMALAGIMTMIGLILLNSDFSIYFPWSIPGIYTIQLTQGEYLPSSSYMIMAGTFLISSIANLTYVRLADIDK